MIRSTLCDAKVTEIHEQKIGSQIELHLRTGRFIPALQQHHPTHLHRIMRIPAFYLCPWGITRLQVLLHFVPVHHLFEL